MEDGPVLEPWVRRLGAYLRHNSDRIVVDGTILLAWIVVSAALFRWLVIPRWLHSLVLLVGIVVYSVVTPGWDRPRSGSSGARRP